MGGNNDDGAFAAKVDCALLSLVIISCKSTWYRGS